MTSPARDDARSAAPERGASGCLCCGSPRLARAPSLVSPFLARRAFGERPEPTDLLTCEACGFAFYARGLTDDDVRAYYAGYRDEGYLRERRSFEPFYTRRVHDELTRCLASRERRDALAAWVRAAAPDVAIDRVLDHGGGSGVLVGDFAASRRAVFDPSGVPTEPGVVSITDAAALGNDWDLVVSAQVLEHVSDPAAVLAEVAACARRGGLVYVEVPNQLFRKRGPATPRALLVAACALPPLLLALDVYSTAFRVKLGVLPPFGFVPMRKHVSFFTEASLGALARRVGLRVLSLGPGIGGFHLVAQKP